MIITDDGGLLSGVLEDVWVVERDTEGADDGRVRRNEVSVHAEVTVRADPRGERGRHAAAEGLLQNLPGIST
jgi:hypothetical protein